MRVYKTPNPYFKKLFVISASRISLCVLPVFLLIFYMWKIGYEDYLTGLVFAALLAGIIAAYAALSHSYRVLLSGYRGERKLYKIIKHIRWGGESAVFVNLPISYRKNRSEIDMLIVGERGVLIIEVKNHSGVIIGGESDGFWVQRRRFRGERRRSEKKMINPLIQLKRQRGILKSLLRENGLDLWVENLLFFSNPNVKLRLKIGKSGRAFSDRGELIKFINGMKPVPSMTKAKCEMIIDIIRTMS